MPSADTTDRVRLSTFYDMLQHRIGAPAKPLVSRWKASMRETVAEALNDALNQSGFIGRGIRNLIRDNGGRERSNQSRGNIAADALSDALNGAGSRWTILRIKGYGYPDRTLMSARPRFACCFEIKATADWKDGDCNRRVLTSSPRKLLTAIAAGRLPNPPCHLLGTVLYERRTGIVLGVRLDFLEPDSLVNVRLEASTSHSLLSQGTHHCRILS